MRTFFLILPITLNSEQLWIFRIHSRSVFSFFVIFLLFNIFFLFDNLFLRFYISESKLDVLFAELLIAILVHLLFFFDFQKVRLWAILEQIWCPLICSILLGWWLFRRERWGLIRLRRVIRWDVLRQPLICLHIDHLPIRL